MPESQEAPKEPKSFGDLIGENKAVFRREILDIIGDSYFTEDLSSQVNETRVDFEFARDFQESTLNIFKNGVLQLLNVDYTILTARSVRFNTAPLSATKIVVSYVSFE